MIFVAANVGLVGLLHSVHPYVRSVSDSHPAIAWYVTGSILFTMMMAVAIVGAIGRDRIVSIRSLLQSLHIRSLSRRDLAYSLGGVIGVYVLTAIIALVLTTGTGTSIDQSLLSDLGTRVRYIDLSPLENRHRWILLIWLPMYLLNISGEECLWRGVVQARLSTRHRWWICGLLWWWFHWPFGLTAMAILLPLMFVVPWVFDQTRNTTTGILIHGMFNGPLFIASAMDWLP